MQVIEFFDRGALVNPTGVAFMRPDGSEALTYHDTRELTHRIAGALARDGFGPGTPVGVLSSNAPMVLPCVLGVLRAGCSWVALNARSVPAELAALLELVGARVLLWSSSMATVAEEICRSVPTLERTIVMDEPVASAEHLERWLAPPGATAPLPPLDPEAIAGYFGTGGTTGRPKAVEVPHRTFETMIHGFNAHMPERHPVNLVAAPLTHAAGAATFPVLSLGGTNVVHDGVVPAAVLESIEQHRVTRLFLPPTAIYALLASPDVRHRDLSSLRYFLYGAAPMSTDKLEEALDVFGPVMAQCYGQTEAAMLCTFFGPEEHAEARSDPALRHRLASCGRPSLVANVAVIDDDGVPIRRGERGEIAVRTSLRMRGYHRDPDATAAVQLPGGWQATGDVGMIDDDGYVYIVDRTRDVIISGGFNVYPSEIEQVIWGHPAVNDCVVVGLPDDKWGEQVTAFVELKAGAHVGEDVLVAVCRERLGPVKAPKRIVFRDLPRSPVGKVLKRELRDEYWVGRDRRV